MPAAKPSLSSPTITNPSARVRANLEGATPGRSGHMQGLLLYTYRQDVPGHATWYSARHSSLARTLPYDNRHRGRFGNSEESKPCLKVFDLILRIEDVAVFALVIPVGDA